LVENSTDYPLFKCAKNYSEIPNINVNNARRKKGRYL
jgi:hypothetical protein